MDLNPCLRDITCFVQNLCSRKKGMLKPIQLKCFEAAIFYTGRVLWKKPKKLRKLQIDSFILHPNQSTDTILT